MDTHTPPTPDRGDFIRDIVAADLAEGRVSGVVTRFPPEPNGYLHIGHAKSICLNFGIAAEYGGRCHLRFDDTNPVKEDVEYVDSIMEDIQWLGYQWANVYYASDYFQQLWHIAEKLIQNGKAYIDEQSAETIAKQKGTPTLPGTESPYRNRPAAESLELFRKMNTGEIPEGAMVLRAKIDMASSNMHFRDPIMYRVINDHPHHRTGWTWKAYPMYDYAHGQSDYLEGVTHSLCTLEFEVHRPLYDWFIDQFQDTGYRPRQTEFNRLNITYTVMSKRKMLQLVEENLVSGWDDPRMPTLCGLRRRGYTPEAIHNFIDKIGYTKYDGIIDLGLLEHAARETFNKSVTRINAVLNPVKLIITNFPENQSEKMQTENNPEDPEAGIREIIFSRELFIEREDFMEDAPKKFFRMTPGQEVRLKSAYIVKCTGCKKNEEGNITEIYAEYDPQTKSGMPDANRKVKGTLHWLSTQNAIEAEVRLYDRLFSVENPSADERDYRELINPDSLKVLNCCFVEPWIASQKPLSNFQFQRTGYFNIDPDSTPEKLIFNRTVSLKDSWAKEQNKPQ